MCHWPEVREVEARRRRGGASNSLWVSSKVAPGGGGGAGGEEVGGGDASGRGEEILKCTHPPSLQVTHNNGEDAASTRVTTDNEPGSVGREEERKRGREDERKKKQSVPL